MTTNDIWVMPTMDCEPPAHAVSKLSNEKSQTGPDSWQESADSIRGYVEVSNEYGLTPTLFAHPSVAHRHSDLFRRLDERGVCIGLHVHPYKMNRDYRRDLGLYSRAKQTEILSEAIQSWKDALGEHPEYFRPGAWSANDNTFAVLDELGFRGGSISKPGRVKPEQAIGWCGADPFPHRANLDFRLIAGKSDFVEIPNVCDVSRPIHANEADQDRGYEDLYLSSVQQEGNIHNSPYTFDRAAVTENIVRRFVEEDVAYPVLMMNTHSNMNFSDDTHTATENFRSVMAAIERCETEYGVRTRGGTIETCIGEFLSEE